MLPSTRFSSPLSSIVITVTPKSPTGAPVIPEAIGVPSLLHLYSSTVHFDFVVNGDTANIVTNDRNDMTGVGIYTHFKMFNGASTIKQQNITFGNVTLIDGVALPTAVSMDDLINKLKSIGFYAWQEASGGGGATTYQALTDTMPFFGQNGRVPVVNEAQLRLDYTDIPDVSMQSKFPATLVAKKFLQVNNSGTAYVFVDLPAGLSAVKSIDFGRLLTNNDTFLIPEGKTALWMTVNDAPWYPETVNNASEYNTFTQDGQDVITKTPLETGNYIVIFYQ